MNFTDDYTFDENTSYKYMNESEYLRSTLGPKYLSRTLVLPIAFVYVIILVTGVVGNVATCFVICKNSSMQTATNCYLFNLAVSDLLLLLLGLPSELSVFYQQYPWRLGLVMCKLRAYVSEMSSYVSVLTIVAFSLERYFAICHPLRHYASGLKRPIEFITVLWSIALLFALPFAVYTDINYVEYPPKSNRYSEESAICAMQRQNMPEFPLYEFSGVLFFLLPMVFIAVLYVRMVLRIRSNTLEPNVEGCVHGETTQAQSRKTIIWMLSAVVVMFFICWAPFHIQRLLYLYVDNLSTFSDINQWLYPLGGSLYYFSTTVNPILYNMMSTKYRNAFKETLCCIPSNGSTGKLGLSNVKDSGSVYRAGSRSGSQVFRGRTNQQRSVKYSTAGRTENVTRGAVQSQSDDREKEERRAAITNESSINDKIINESLLGGQKKSSLVVQAKNGRVRYQTADKGETDSNEANI